MCLLSATDVGLNNQKISTSSCVLPAEKDYKAFAGNSFTSIDFALKLKERSTRDGMDQEKWQRKLCSQQKNSSNVLSVGMTTVLLP